MVNLLPILCNLLELALLLLYSVLILNCHTDFKSGTVALHGSLYNINQFFFSPLQINEFVDARDLNMGAWFEAQIVNITKTTKTPGEEEGSKLSEEEVIHYHVKYEE